MTSIPVMHWSDVSTATPHGISYWRDLAYGCAKRALLKKESASSSPAESSGSRYAEIGSFYHYFRALYEQQESFECNDVIRLDPGLGLEPALDTAIAMFRAWRGRHKPGYFGEPLAVEDLIPDCEATRKATALPNFTCRPDLVTYMSARVAKKFAVAPGYWLIDYKTCASANEFSARQYINSLQLIAYEEAWNATHPGMDIQGKIVQLCERGGKFQTYDLVLGPNGAVQKKMLRALAVRVGLTLTNKSLQVANPERCYDYGHKCQYLGTECHQF